MFLILSKLLKMRKKQDFYLDSARNYFYVIPFVMMMVGSVLVDSVSAREIAVPFIGVNRVEISMHVNAKGKVENLVEADQLIERIVEYVSHKLRDSRSDIFVERGSNLSAPEVKELESGTLSVAFIVTVRPEIGSASGLPCCFGALAMRVDRDAFRRRPAAELIHSEDFYRVNWAPEPLFLGQKKGAAEDLVFLTSVQLLERVLIPLGNAPPNN